MADLLDGAVPAEGSGGLAQCADAVRGGASLLGDLRRTRCHTGGALAASESPAFAGAPIPGLGQPFNSAASPGLQWFGYNLYAPWAAGWYFRPVAMLCAAAAVFMATGAMSYLFQFAPLPRRLQDRSAALGLYTSGALVSGFITGLAVIAVILLLIIALGGFDQAWQVALGWGVPFTLVAWWLAVWRTYRRVCHAGAVRSIVATAVIIAVTLLAILYAVLFIPWCVGVVRILISALEVQT